MVHMLNIFMLIVLFSLFACAPVSKKTQMEHNQADVHYKMALAHLQGDNPTLALRELLIAVKQDPQNSSIHVALAQTYQRKNAYPLAEKHYLKALDLSDQDPRYLNNLASLYLDMEKWDEAITYFDQASMDLLFVNAHVAVAGKAYAYFKKMDYQSALKFSTEAIKIAPRYASAYFLKSEICRAMGDIDREKFNLQRTIDIAPQFLRARYQLAVLLLEENSMEEAAIQLRTILEFSPTSELGYKAKGLLQSIPDS